MKAEEADSSVNLVNDGNKLHVLVPGFSGFQSLPAVKIVGTCCIASNINDLSPTGFLKQGSSKSLTELLARDLKVKFSTGLSEPKA